MVPTPEPVHKIAASLEPFHKMAASPKSSVVLDVMPASPAIMNIALEASKAAPRQLRLMSSVADPGLVSVKAAGILVT